ncbi:MAG: family 78 glycoside hydrolase catalytic domain [Lachnospiraceae bacterium]|nr:family 78 glycoside hydrolase catalytic domain [Lachnospiraceae bacterium]
MKITNLKTNYQINPIGIELSGITFSWEVTEAAGSKQKSARFLLSETEDFKELVFDSDKGSEGDHKLNAGAYTPELTDLIKPGKTYYWKVEEEDETGDRGESMPASFEGGHPEGPWHAKWITPPYTAEIHPVFRKKFKITPDIFNDLKRARLYICGLGLYEACINGKKVGEDFLTPYFTDYRYHIEYQTYDIASYLKEGENTIDVMLGEGWYKGKFGYLNAGQLRDYYGDKFKLIAEIDISVKEEHVYIGTDADWQTLKSPVILSGIYDGEDYDARQEAELVAPPARKIAKSLVTKEPIGKLTAMIGVPVRHRETLKVKEIITTRIGETVLDFGQEITGIVSFMADAPIDQRITLKFGEVLQDGIFYRDNLRTARASYTYISDGQKKRVRPHFTFFGFRYVKVTGMKVDSSNQEDFEAWALYSDIEETGTITTSNEKLNRLIENTKWSEKDNFLDIPTDCPQRDERCGWTGDAQIFSSAASYHMQTPAFFRKYMKDMDYEQKELGGSVPYVVPDVLNVARIKNAEAELDHSTDEWGEDGSSVWGDAATIIPMNMYRHYGNIAWLSEQYSNMKQWVEFIREMERKYCKGKRLWTCGFHFGDWLSLDAEGDSREGGTDKYFVASVFYMYSARLLAEAAKLLKKNEEAKEYEKLSEEIRKAVRKEYMDENGRLKYDTQTAYVIGIHLDLFNKEEKKAAGDHLSELLSKNNDHLLTGFVGTPYLCYALSETGHTEQAYTLLLNEDFPSWLYEVNLGATTIWERWNSLLEDGSISSTGMNSLNHYAYGSVVEWIYSRMCGLTLDPDSPGSKKVILKPCIDPRLDFAKASIHTIAGVYKAGWKWMKKEEDPSKEETEKSGIDFGAVNGNNTSEGKGLKLEFTVPFDAEVEIELPFALENAVVKRKEEETVLSDGAANINHQLFHKGSYVITGRVVL